MRLGKIYNSTKIIIVLMVQNLICGPKHKNFG